MNDIMLPSLIAADRPHPSSSTRSSANRKKTVSAYEAQGSESGGRDYLSSIRDAETDAQLLDCKRELEDLKRRTELDPGLHAARKSEEAQRSVDALRQKFADCVAANPENDELRSMQARFAVACEAHSTPTFRSNLAAHKEVDANVHNPLTNIEDGIRTVQDIRKDLQRLSAFQRDLQYTLMDRKLRTLEHEFHNVHKLLLAKHVRILEQSPLKLAEAERKTTELELHFHALKLHASTTYRDAFHLLDEAHLQSAAHPVPYDGNAFAVRSHIIETLSTHLGALRLQELRNKGFERPRPGPDQENSSGVQTRKFIEFLTLTKDTLVASNAYVDQTSFETIRKHRATLRTSEIQSLISNSSDEEICEALGSAVFGLARESKYHQFLVDRAAASENQSAVLNAGEFEQLLVQIGETPKKSSVAKTKRKGKTNARRGPRPANVSSAAGESTENITADALRSQIALKQGDARAANRLEGDVAHLTLEICEKQLTSFARLLGFNVILRDARRVLAEFDIDTNVAIIEVTLMRSGKFNQIEKRALNLNGINDNLKPVILYAPNYTDAAKNELAALQQAKHSAPVFMVRTEDELHSVLARLDEDLFARTASQIGFV